MSSTVMGFERFMGDSNAVPAAFFSVPVPVTPYGTTQGFGVLVEVCVGE
jgi:hypothetical protein